MAGSHLSQISAILLSVRKADTMCKKFTPDELNKMDHETKNGKQWGLTLLRKNTLSKEITNKTGAIALIMFGSTLR